MDKVDKRDTAIRSGSAPALTSALKELEQQGISQEAPIWQRTFAHLLNWRARREAVPQCGIFELTPRCNLACKMCYVHLEKGQMKGARELPGSVWVSLMDEAMESGMMKAQLTGGEALLHPDFDDIYLHLYDRGIWISLLSNGLLLNRERVDFLKEHPPRSLQVTLYGSDDESYRHLTGRAVFGLARENILRAKEIRTGFSLSVTPGKYFPVEEVRRALQFAREENIRIQVNGDLTEPYVETGRELAGLEFGEDEYIEMCHMMREFYGREAHVHAGELPKPVETAEPGRGVVCAAGRALFAINWRGEMRACLDLPFKAYPLREGFRKSWEHIHEMAMDYPFPGECLSCAYVKLCTKCPVTHARGAAPGHADKRICGRAVRMVREGLVKLEDE